MTSDSAAAMYSSPPSGLMLRPLLLMAAARLADSLPRTKVVLTAACMGMNIEIVGAQQKLCRLCLFSNSLAAS